MRIVFLGFVLLVGHAQAAPLTLAAPGLSGLNVPKEEAAFFTDHVAQQLTLQGAQVTTSSQIASIIGHERQKQLLGCSSETASCMAELGGALGVDGLVVGTVAKLGETYQLNVNVISASDGKSLTAYSASAPSAERLLGEINAAAPRLARELAQKLGRTLAPPAAASTSAARRFWWVPTAAGVAAAGGATFFFLTAKGHSDAITGGPDRVSTLTWDQAQQRAADGASAQRTGFILAGAGAALVLGGAAMYLLGGTSADSSVSVVVGPSGASAGFSRSF